MDLNYPSVLTTREANTAGVEAAPLKKIIEQYYSFHRFCKNLVFEG